MRIATALMIIIRYLHSYSQALQFISNVNDAIDNEKRERKRRRLRIIARYRNGLQNGAEGKNMYEEKKERNSAGYYVGKAFIQNIIRRHKADNSGQNKQDAMTTQKIKQQKVQDDDFILDPEKNMKKSGIRQLPILTELDAMKQNFENLLFSNDAYMMYAYLTDQRIKYDLLIRVLINQLEESFLVQEDENGAAVIRNARQRQSICRKQQQDQLIKHRKQSKIAENKWKETNNK
ncbi:MAG: hypothetical protein EZS28_017517 [Streblomastix strix]|uniref:Uncharacterized protein n=1 Tax=Streblomastix strix TaxID=222440 RepID=A0A5J4VXP7_9EUKA|nr:MAG: hypothetical protein EZS28_017517 [Streblomastix strix]